MGPGDLVVYLPDPLILGGELLILAVTADGRLECEAVHYEAEAEDVPAPRMVVWPHELELASRWART